MYVHIPQVVMNLIFYSERDSAPWVPALKSNPLVEDVWGGRLQIFSLSSVIVTTVYIVDLGSYKEADFDQAGYLNISKMLWDISI